MQVFGFKLIDRVGMNIKNNNLFVVYFELENLNNLIKVFTESFKIVQKQIIFTSHRLKNTRTRHNKMTMIANA